MRSLAPMLALPFCALACWAACSSETTAPPLLDCVDPTCLQRRPVPPAPSVFNRPPAPQQDAGVAVVDGGAVGNTIPEAGPGPGVGPSIGGTGLRGAGAANSNELGPVCPLDAPTNGAPCDPVVNLLPCSYGNLTCSCVTSWLCL